MKEVQAKQLSEHNSREDNTVLQCNSVNKINLSHWLCELPAVTD